MTKVIERQDAVVRLEGVPGWVAVDSASKPCGDCGGTIFTIGKWRLFCKNCLSPNEDEPILGEIDVSKIGGLQ